MNLKELSRILKCQRLRVFERIDIFVSYCLFRAKLTGSDFIDGVGTFKISKDNKKVEVKLEERWVELLNGKNCEEHLLKFLLELVENEKPTL